MENPPTIRAEIGPTLKLAVPIMLGMLGYGLMFVVDVAMAGHLGETALAASALASNLNYIPYVFGIGVVGAIAVYQSQDNGAGVEESAPAILRHGMILAVANERGFNAFGIERQRKRAEQARRLRVADIRLDSRDDKRDRHRADAGDDG